jgi:hypothetical protein
MTDFGLPLVLALLVQTNAADLSLLPVVVPATNKPICAVAWSQNIFGIYSDPTNACISTNGNQRWASWGRVPDATNYVLAWSRNPITNLVPDASLQSTNTGTNTAVTFFISPTVTEYGLIFIQGSTNGPSGPFYDLTNIPYLRLTNDGVNPLPWQWFRSRTENTTNWR